MRILNASRLFVAACGLVALAPALAAPAVAQVLPGTGTRIAEVGDNFEDEKWAYNTASPKSSYEQDDQIRNPGGSSTNGRWAESAKRGHPDLIRRVATPPDGIPGSNGALQLQTLQSGIPGNISGENRQDDLICNVQSRLRGQIPASSSPSLVVRVLIPPFEKWEQRAGNSFGVRLSCEGYKPSNGEKDTYWPGMFISYFPPAPERGRTPARPAYAQLVLRGASTGGDMAGPKITEPGWWTLGLSVSPDGTINYYAHAGVEDLTSEDRITSQTPYGFRAERLQSFFFDLVNRDDGHSWSTPWVIDDAFLYATSPRVVPSGGPEYEPKEDKKGNQDPSWRGFGWRRRR